MTDKYLKDPEFYQCVRVYRNGDRHQENVISRVEMLKYVAYNRHWRPGTAQFVNGQCVNYGYLSPAECKVLSDELTPPGSRYDPALPGPGIQ